MFTNQREWSTRLAAFLVFILAFSACSLPIPGFPAQEPTIMPGVSDAMLTAAAATIGAQLDGQGGPEPAITELAPATAMPQAKPSLAPQSAAPTTAPLTATPLPTNTPIVLPSATTEVAQGGVAATATPASGVTVIPVTVVPFLPPVIEYGTHFIIQNINLHPCAGATAANFKIRNQGSTQLKLLSLHLQDLSTGAVLLGPWVSNAPFMDTDRTCAAGGLDQLNSGHTGYIGNSLGGSNLKGHTIRATI